MLQILNQAGRNESCCGEGTYGFHPNGTKVTVTAEVCNMEWENLGHRSKEMGHGREELGLRVKRGIHVRTHRYIAGKTATRL
jgi:hypothetical protein